MNICIISAMEEEILPLVNYLSDSDFFRKETKFDNFSVVSFSKKDLCIRLMVCGIGKVNAAMGTQFLVSQYSPNLVINVGVAGSISDRFKLGDVVLAKEVTYHDFDLSVFGHLKGKVPEEPLYFSTALEKYNLLDYIDNIAVFGTGDFFVEKKDLDKVTINNIEVVDMESAAVGHVCKRNCIDFLAIRSISDDADSEVYSSKLKEASDKTLDLLITLLYRIQS